MRAIVTFLLLALSTTFALAQSAVGNVVISEIMYNPPEAGNDSLEFIELYNRGSQPVNLQGCNFTAGVVFTFQNAHTLQPGQFVIVGVDSAALLRNFGVAAYKFVSGALSNSGERIELRDGQGNVVDSLRYSNAAPWPAAANGLGSSLVLCDVSADNALAASWASATTSAGFSINGLPVFASPGAANNCSSGPPPSYPAYPIGQVTTVNAQGVADSVGTRCQLEGIVYGNNLRPGGLQFTLIDETNYGIAVFFNSGDFGYAVTEGDRVIGRGVVSQYNGLLQFNLDTLWRVSSGNALVQAAVVTALSEQTESRLVKLLNVELVDPAQWMGAGSGFNVDVTDGNGNVHTLRIDNDVDLFTAPAPTGRFNVTGLGGQFDASAPFTEGYQLLPRYAADIVPTGVSNEQEAFWQASLKLYPNPATALVFVELPVVCDRLVLTDGLGRVLMERNPSAASFELSLAGLAAGNYYLRLHTSTGIAVRMINKQ
jgi:hypothetical protein